MAGFVAQLRHFAAEAGPGKGALELAAHGVHAAAGAQGQHGVVDPRRAAGDPLRRGQRGEEDGELRLGAAEFAAAWAGDDEVLGGAAEADVAQAPAAGEAHDAPCRQVVVGGEAALEHGDRAATVAGTKGAPGLGVDAVDRRSVRPESASRRFRPGRAAIPRPGARTSTWVDRRRRSSVASTSPAAGIAADQPRERPGRSARPLGQRDLEVVGVQGREAGVVGGDPPGLHAAEAGVDAGADRQDQPDRQDQGPAPAQIAERPAQPEPEPSHPHQCRSAISAGPPGFGASATIATAGELDHPVGDAGDLAVVGDDEDRGVLAVGLLVQQVEDLHAGAEVELAGRLVGQQDRVAGRQRAGDRHPLLLAAGELVREVLAAGPSPTRSSIWAATSRASPWPLTSAPNSTFSSAVSAGKRLKVWKMKLTARRRKAKRSARDAPLMSSPPIRIVPSLGESRAPIMLSRVVLPLPEGPRTTMNSPRSIRRSTSSRAVTVTSPMS